MSYNRLLKHIIDNLLSFIWNSSQPTFSTVVQSAVWVVVNKRQKYASRQISYLRKGITNNIMKAIILAAGIGNRLGNYAEKKPKSLLEFDGKSLLKRHIEILLANKIDALTIVTGYESELIKAHLAD